MLDKKGFNTTIKNLFCIEDPADMTAKTNPHKEVCSILMKRGIEKYN